MKKWVSTEGLPTRALVLLIELEGLGVVESKFFRVGDSFVRHYRLKKRDEK